MRPVVTPAEAAALDSASEAAGITTAFLMENAGRATAMAVADLAGGVYGRRVVIVCGKGNNGGDGLVAARHLSRSGMRVSVVMMEDPSSLSGLAAATFARLAEAPGVRVRGQEGLDRELARADIVVDAIFGTGFSGAPEGAYAQAISAINGSEVPVLAVDVPSGVDGGNGAVVGEAVSASVTVTFGAAKAGLILYPGAAFAGLVEVADIGFPPELVTSDLWMIERADIAALLPERGPDSHKRATGVVLIVGGSRSMTGAVCLAADAAYRAGAGLVTVAMPESILPVIESAVLEATFLPLPETADGTIAAAAFDVLWERLGSFDAIAVGPGMSTHEETAGFTRGLVAAAPKGLVVDADGLNAFAGRLEEFDDRGSADIVLTPHVGEFARLMGIGSSEVEADRVARVRALSARVGSTVLLKGSRTLIAEPSGVVRINPTGSSALATAGTGDVLTGAIAAFMARGLDSYDAATVGAYLHGLAGLVAASQLGEGTTAGDVAESLPEILEEVRAG